MAVQWYAVGKTNTIRSGLSSPKPDDSKFDYKLMRIRA